MAVKSTIPNLEAKASERKSVFTPRQWLETQIFKKHKIAIIGMIDNGWTEKKLIYTTVFGVISPYAQDPIMRAKYRREANKHGRKALVKSLNEN